MKKIIITSLAALSMGITVFSQNCNLILKDGGKYTLQIQSWTNPLIGDTEFLEAEEENKEKQIASYNADVLSGKIIPASNYPMPFTIRKGDIDGWQEYTLTTNIAGTDYSGYEFCNKDTMYVFRNRGPVVIGTKENPIGYTIQGVQKLPVNMKVGDVLPTFKDISFIFPQTMDATVKHKVSNGFYESGVSKFGYFTDSRTREAGYGPYTDYTPVEIFKFIDVEVRETISFSGHSINYMYALVTAEDELTISGLKYKAFIIESESWNKVALDVSYESADEEVSTEKIRIEQEALDKKVGETIEKQATKKGFTNDLGYSVMYKREWFVPQIGIVKTVAFDMYGGISTIMTTTGLE